MRIVKVSLALSAVSVLATACGGGGLLNRDRPDEFAVARSAPLVVPPDFALVPPTSGQVSSSGDSRAQALETLFGGPAPRSASEQQILSQVDRDRAAQGVRSNVADPNTNVVDKGPVTRTILAVPEGDGQEASVRTPQ